MARVEQLETSRPPLIALLGDCSPNVPADRVAPHAIELTFIGTLYQPEGRSAGLSE